ncbi:MAG: epimerase [Rhodobacteraceae bacterium]|nr:epimerase [Paracoccaceae bacterium]
MTKTILILGGNGRFGRNASEAFRRAGWTIRQFDRSRDDLMQAAAGADIILNGWNPPYTDWASEVPALTAQVIAAAKASGATVILPGNVYVFGRDAPARFDDATPHRATNGLGRIRIGMEDAYRRSGVRTILVRAGDYIDTCASGNWFDMILTKKLAKGIFTYPGNPDVPHGWAYLPDLLRAIVDLAEMRDQLAPFEDIAFPGYTMSGNQLCAALAEATGRPVRLKRMNWWPIRAAGLVWPMGRRLAEMSYLWSKPHHLGGAKFDRLLPDFRPTPASVALASAIGDNVNPDQPVVRADIAVTAH